MTLSHRNQPSVIEYAGTVYHVMARGNQGRDIEADDRERKLRLETLGEACEKTGWRIHAWVMMNNHYHLLLETPEANLVAGMKWLQGHLHPLGRVAGSALCARGVACWFAQHYAQSCAARSLVTAMVVYNLGAAQLPLLPA